MPRRPPCCPLQARASLRYGGGVSDFTLYLLSRALQRASNYWLTCPVEVVRAHWIPSQAGLLLAVREQADKVAA